VCNLLITRPICDIADHVTARVQEMQYQSAAAQGAYPGGINGNNVGGITAVLAAIFYFGPNVPLFWLVLLEVSRHWLVLVVASTCDLRGDRADRVDWFSSAVVKHARQSAAGLLPCAPRW
jgi:hypothetical protein